MLDFVNSANEWNCDTCGEKFPDLPSVRKHIQKKHPQPVKEKPVQINSSDPSVFKHFPFLNKNTTQGQGGFVVESGMLEELQTLLAEQNSEERDPNGIPAKQPGAKLDAGKPPVDQGFLTYFPQAIKAIAMVSLYGANKYSWKGWEKVENGPQRYADALGRHILDRAINGPYDADTGLLHDAHIAWNALARLELLLRDGVPLKNSMDQTPKPSPPSEHQ